MKNNQIIKCPECKGLTVNNGKNRSGTQRMSCTECGKRFTPNPKEKGYPQEMRDQAIKMHYAGSSGRQVGKILGMSKANVYIWAKKNLGSVDK